MNPHNDCTDEILKALKNPHGVILDLILDVTKYSEMV